ncbi:MAG: hypothetical protein AAGA85_08315 [Bacteroidota bacterium]
MKRYQKSFGEAVVGQSYANRDALSGKDLLHLTPSKQVNFFVMKALFNQWQEEMRRLESPYFDYKVPEVKKAMVQFMNVLSQNIRVERDEIDHLLNQALEQTLLIVVSPTDFVKREFQWKAETAYSPKQATQLLKYIKVLSKEFHDLFLDQSIATYAEIIEKTSEFFSSVDLTEAREKVFQDLNEVAPISLKELLPEAATPKEEIEEAVIPEEVIPAIERSEEEPASEPIVEDEPEEQRPETINDQFDTASDTSLAEHLQQSEQAATIMDTISLNQRYMFAQELFSGDANVFQQAIGEIEHERSFDEAVEHLVSNYAAVNEWDMNSDVVKELLKAVFRKFR